jgi:hypothetical protein
MCVVIGMLMMAVNTNNKTEKQLMYGLSIFGMGSLNEHLAEYIAINPMIIVSFITIPFLLTSFAYVLRKNEFISKYISSAVVMSLLYNVLFDIHLSRFSKIFLLFLIQVHNFNIIINEYEHEYNHDFNNVMLKFITTVAILHQMSS